MFGGVITRVNPLFVSRSLLRQTNSLGEEFLEAWSVVVQHDLRHTIAGVMQEEGDRLVPTLNEVGPVLAPSARMNQTLIWRGRRSSPPSTRCQEVR